MSPAAGIMSVTMAGLVSFTSYEVAYRVPRLLDVIESETAFTIYTVGDSTRELMRTIVFAAQMLSGFLLLLVFI